MPRPADRTTLRARGFTLLEVMVAFLIGALALAALMEGAGRGLLGSRTGDRSAEALSRARSRLAATLAQPVLAPVDQAGEDGGGFAWRLRVVPIAESRGLALYEVRVAITWPAGRGVRGVELATRQPGTPAR